MDHPTLIFVYNADSGLINTLLDIGHRLVSPGTYNCKLCTLTHSTFGMRAKWRAFVERLKVPPEFLHRDELAERHGMTGTALPAILYADGSTATPWINAAEINRCHLLSELEALIAVRLSELDAQGK